MNPDNNLAAEFFHHTKEYHDEAGNRKYKDSVYVKIRAKGMKDSHSREMKEEDKLRFPMAWKRFEKDNSFVDGTPLKALPFTTPSMIRELENLEIHSVEDLAHLQEMAVSKIHRGRTLQKQAIAYLAAMEVEDEIDEIDEPVSEELLNDEDVVQLNKPVPKKKVSRKKK